MNKKEERVIICKGSTDYRMEAIETVLKNYKVEYTKVIKVEYPKVIIAPSTLWGVHVTQYKYLATNERHRSIIHKITGLVNRSSKLIIGGIEFSL